MRQHLTGETFSGIFENPQICKSLTPNHVVISFEGGILTVEEQIITVGAFDSKRASAQVWPLDGPMALEQVLQAVKENQTLLAAKQLARTAR